MAAKKRSRHTAAKAGTKSKVSAMQNTDPNTEPSEETQLSSDSIAKPENTENIEEDEDNEEEDEDYDPNAAHDSDSDLEGEAEDDKSEYSRIESASVSQVRTRFQRQNDAIGLNSGSGALVANASKLDLDSIFNDLNASVGTQEDEWKNIVTKSGNVSSGSKNSLVSIPSSLKTDEQQQVLLLQQQQLLSLEKDKIRIETTYTFAGKIITESKLVDADSAEAKVYQNSTDLINKSTGESMKGRRPYIPVIRTIPGETEPVALRIKLKRPSLIDKFLDTYLNKKLKLSTLEKSRLDWASFVDKKQIQDELRVANKAGYLDKQDFLNRVEWKRDEQYKQAKEMDRQQKLREEQNH